MSRCTILVTVLAVGASAASDARGDGKAARARLRAMGLRPVGSYFMLPAEKELGERLKAVEPTKKELDKAIKRRTAHEKSISAAKSMLEGAIQQRRRLTVMLFQTRTDKEAAQIAGRLLEVSDRIEILGNRINDPTESRAINRQVAIASEAYTKELLDLRALVDEAYRRYQVLADDPEVQRALDELRRESGRRISLGPRGIFDKYVGKLERLEESIAAADIELRAHEGVLWVNTIINGHINEPMVLDTGASIISIPHQLAVRFGLQPTDDHPTVQMALADGKTVEGKLMSLDSVRVGRFRVENVACVVMPAQMSDAPPLLGGSFLRHFTCKINHEAGRLTLTQVVDPSDE